MTTLSFNGANLVAQQLDWSMTEGWSQGDNAANDYYRPIETFPERFAAFVDHIVDAGFDTLDVWTGQLNWTWATADHLAAAQEVLASKGVSVASYAGYFGDAVDEFRAACDVASALGTCILGGSAAALDADRVGVIETLRATGCLLAIENHPEASPAEMRDKIGADAEGLIGTAVDTGWWGTQGFDAAEAIRQLGDHVMYVHLKDILAAGAHETCALGDGIVPIEGCIAAMAEIGYAGAISVEHEPEHYDPTPEVILSRARILEWMS